MGKGNKRERQKRGVGRLYKRGKDGKECPANSPTHGVFWLEYRVNGKRKRQALRYPDGEPITRLKEAEAERLRIMKPFTSVDKAEQLRDIKAILSDVEGQIEEAQKAAFQAPRWEDAWDLYMASQSRPRSGAATLANYERHLRKFHNWLLEFFPEVGDVAAVTPKIAREYAGHIDPETGRADLSENTFNKRIGFLKLFYRIMVEDERVESNPFAKIKRRTVHANSRKELSLEQVFRLISTASGELALLLGLGYFTGLRRGDCCTLRWSEVDLVCGIITRVPNKTGRRKGNNEPLKIGIAPDLHKALSSIPPAERGTYVLPDMAALYLDDTRRDRISRTISTHFEDCGICTIRPGTGKYKDERTGKWVDTGKRAVVDYGFHSLRYSYISHHAERGTPQAVIQANAGHRNPAMTEHYTKISDDTARRVAGVLSLPPAEESRATNDEAVRQPLPQWALELVAKLTPENCGRLKAELLGEED